MNTVFQSYALFPHMSIIDNVSFGLKRRRIDDAVGKAHEALRLVELDHLAQRPSAQLSGGQQQRVALARAIVNRPRCCCSTSRSARSTSSCAGRCSSS